MAYFQLYDPLVFWIQPLPVTLDKPFGQAGLIL